MKKITSYSLITAAMLLSLALVLSSCSGSGNSSGVAPGSGGTSASFHIKGASQLIALSSTVATKPTGFLKGVWAKATGEPLQITAVNQGLSDEEVRARAKGKIGVASAPGGTPAGMGTNLFSIDVSGNAQPAITSSMLIKVMYSVTDPAGNYVYLALDTGFINPDGNDYTPFIASNNCAFYRVSTADNSYSCVQEGVYVQPIDDTYLKTVSNNMKPIQFDTEGNVFFPGTTFSRSCDPSNNCTISVANWRPRIYRVSAVDQSVVALTQDNQNISYYLALKTGEIAYQSVSPLGTTIYLWQPDPSHANVNGITVDMTGPSNNINFFTNDTFNTIIFGGFTTNGIRFAKPATGGGVEKALLDTSIFKSSNVAADQQYINSGCGFINYDWQSNSYPPSKVIVGDDGKLYGVFGPTVKPNYVKLAGSSNDDCTKTTYSLLYKVFQVLPFNPVPKAEIETPRDLPYTAINVFGGTPFQVANGKFFYKETRERKGYGVYDVINMVDLSTRVNITLLNDPNTFYEMYSWRVRGNKIYFSALDLARTVVVSGTIDTTLASTTALQQTFLHIQDMTSAVGSSSRVQDIEGLAALPTVAGDPGPPVVKNIFTARDNIYSMSLQFSRLMDESTVEPNTSVTALADNKSIATMKVWINDYLHLIPDLDNNGTTQPDDALLDLAGTTPLSLGEVAYGIDVTTLAKDTAGDDLVSEFTTSLVTVPKYGWYADLNIAKFAGSQTIAQSWGSYYPEWMYDLYVGPTSSIAADNVPPDFRLQFKARNLMSNGVEIMLWDNNPTPMDGTYYRSCQRDYLYL